MQYFLLTAVKSSHPQILLAANYIPKAAFCVLFAEPHIKYAGRYSNGSGKAVACCKKVKKKKKERKRKEKKVGGRK